MSTRLLLLLFLVLASTASAGEDRGPPAAVLELPDGRRIVGTRLRQRRDRVVLTTLFGPLEVPRSLLGDGESNREPPVVHEGRWKRTSRWFEIESDLTGERADLYADELDSYFTWLVRTYDLDRGRLKSRAPFPIYVFRSRKDFKAAQRDVAPQVAERKGKDFADGVAGFHGTNGTYLWDAEGSRGSLDLQVGKHEVTHLANSLLAEERGLRMPTWFEEGTATYFMTASSLGRREPEDDPGRLSWLLGELGAGRGMSNRKLRSIPYETFYSPEYSWSYALIRFFRRDGNGRRWKAVLEFLPTAGSGAPADSENHRWLEAVGAKSDEELDREWHAHLEAARDERRRGPHGISPEALAEVRALEKPGRVQARLLRRLGEAFARMGLAEAAVVYLSAAVRGGIDDGPMRTLLAGALAEAGRSAWDGTWPDEALEQLRRAVEIDPLNPIPRHLLGVQLLARATNREEAVAARDKLGLALILCGPNDDRVTVALSLLGAEAEIDSEGQGRDLFERLLQLQPELESDLRRARLYHMQGLGRWEELLTLLEESHASTEGTFEERKMLAGLYEVSDRLPEAASLYEGLLEERPDALYLYLPRIRCLRAMGKREEASLAVAAAREAISRAPAGFEALRRQLRALSRR